MVISFKSQTQKVHFHSEFCWNTSLGSVMTMRKLFTTSSINSLLWGRVIMMLLRPVAQLYGQVRTDWNQCIVIDCSLSHPAGHKPFACLHSVLPNTWLNIHAVHWMRFSARLSVHVFTIQRNLTGGSFSSVVPWASCRLSDPLSVYCDIFAAI